MDIVVDSREMNYLVEKLFWVVGSFKRNHHSLFDIADQEDDLALNPVRSKANCQIKEIVGIKMSAWLATPVENGLPITVGNCSEVQELFGEVFPIAA